MSFRYGATDAIVIDDLPPHSDEVCLSPPPPTAWRSGRGDMLDPRVEELDPNAIVIKAADAAPRGIIRRIGDWLRPRRLSANPGDGSLRSEIDARFLEQEHRAPQVFWNAMESFGWKEGDPRRDAARRAMVWRIFAPAAVLAGGATAATILTGLTVWEMMKQTDEMRVQNVAVRDQLKLMQEQTTEQSHQNQRQEEQYATTQKAILLATIYDEHDCTPGEIAAAADIAAGADEETAAYQMIDKGRCPNATGRTRTEAVRALSTVSNGGDPIDLSGAPLSGLEFPPMSFEGVYLAKARFRGSVFSGTGHLHISAPRADFTDAKFLRATIIDAVFTDAKFTGAVFDIATLSNVDFDTMNFVSGVDLRGATFRSANLIDVDLAHADLTDSDFSHATLTQVDLNVASLDYANLVGTDLRGARDLPQDIRGCVYCPAGKNKTEWPSGYSISAGDDSCWTSERACEDADGPWTRGDVTLLLRQNWKLIATWEEGPLDLEHAGGHFQLRLPIRVDTEGEDAEGVDFGIVTFENVPVSVDGQRWIMDAWGYPDQIMEISVRPRDP